MTYQSANILRRPQDEIEREREAAFIPSLEADLRRLRAARTGREMRVAIEGAGEPLRILRERIETLSAQRIDLMRRSTPRATVAIDEKLTPLRAVEESFSLLIADFERDLPGVEQREATEMEALRRRLAPLVAAREEAAARLLSRRQILSDIANDATEYAHATKAIAAERARMPSAGIDEAAIGIDLSAPLVPSRRGRPSFDEERMGFVNGNFPAGLRIPGLAARGEPEPDWVYVAAP